MFDCDGNVITKHLNDIFESGELKKETVCANFAHTAENGKTYNTKFYSLDAIIAVGYRANSIRATQFRQWATSVLWQYAIQGYVLDRKRMGNGTFLSEDYFEHLLAEIHEIRLSKRQFYQKLTDIYATSMDYNKDAPTTRLFYKKIQDKIHNVAHRRMATWFIMEQADTDMEQEDMSRIMTAVLDFAESQAKRHIPMTMEDWAKRIDAYLLMPTYINGNNTLPCLRKNEDHCCREI